MNNIVRQINRILIALLFIFVVLNWSSVLEYGTYYTWRGLVFTILVVTILLETASYYLYKKRGKPLNGWFYLPAIFLLYYDVIGDTLYFYRDYLWYDQVAHFFGGAAVMLILWQFIKQNKICLSLKGKLLFAMAGAWSLGTVYEIEEYFEDLIYGSNRLGDGMDTANDLFLNNLGALLTALGIGLVVYLYQKKKK